MVRGRVHVQCSSARRDYHQGEERTKVGLDLELVGVNCGRQGTEKGVSMIGKSLDLLENPGLVFAGVLHL